MDRINRELGEEISQNYGSMSLLTPQINHLWAVEGLMVQFTKPQVEDSWQNVEVSWVVIPAMQKSPERTIFLPKVLDLLTLIG